MFAPPTASRQNCRLIAGSILAAAQDGFLRQHALQRLNIKQNEIVSLVQHAVLANPAEQGAVASVSADDKKTVVIEALQAKEPEVHTMIALVNGTSLLVDARSSVTVMLCREERQAFSPDCDARFAEHTGALAAIDDQLLPARTVEATLVALLDGLRTDDTPPDVSQVLLAQAALLSGLATNVLAEESCLAGPGPSQISTGTAYDPRRTLAPNAGDVPSCSMSSGIDGPATSPGFHDMRNPE